ncbi:MAG: bifunctional phosphopantothenoylcysteine decarboxylase/phosphopantothenate--cysteine ligase CoaBC [Bacteroidota bacterium]|jgi:phosphopantothenoylcysteine decarboxylase/phosphopantothenate--cysteine ligase
MLQGKKILIGVSGSIAAYKTAFLIRLLKKQKAEVKVVCTPSASSFIGKLTLATLSENEVYDSFYNQNQTDWTNHVELGLWADLFIIVPATANTIAKMANGICDNLLLAVYLSAKCKVMVAPAMDLDMFVHPSTQNNLVKIIGFGNIVLDSPNGELASGLVGKGRVEEPEKILEFISDFFEQKNQLKGKKVLVTAGPTYESLDPVRFIGNHSSGKMGIAIAESYAKRGADVVLICGPSSISSSQAIQRIDVISAQEMFESVNQHLDYDIAVLSAAVADYTPITYSNEKIKKSGGNLVIELQKTKDILAYLGKNKNQNQTLVGFAMETQNLEENARLKLKNKNADLIVLNSLKEEGAGFKYDTNKVYLVSTTQTKTLPLLTKQQVAEIIVEETLVIQN